MAIREIKHENSKLYFVADDLGQPISGGYLSLSRAEQVEQLIVDSDGRAELPRGVDIEKILADYR